MSMAAMHFATLALVLFSGMVSLQSPAHVSVGILDQAQQRCSIDSFVHPQLHMPHAPAVSFEQSGRVIQLRAHVEADVDM